MMNLKKHAVIHLFAGFIPGCAVFTLVLIVAHQSPHKFTFWVVFVLLLTLQEILFWNSFRRLAKRRSEAGSTNE